MLFDTCVHTRPITHTCGRMLCNVEMIITVSLCMFSIQNVINIYDHYLYITNIHIAPPFIKSVCKFRSCRLYIYIYTIYMSHVYRLYTCIYNRRLYYWHRTNSGQGPFLAGNDILTTHKIMYVK